MAAIDVGLDLTVKPLRRFVPGDLGILRDAGQQLGAILFGGARSQAAHPAHARAQTGRKKKPPIFASGDQGEERAPG